MTDTMTANAWPGLPDRARIRGAYLNAASIAVALLRHPAVAEAWAEPSVLPHYRVSGLAGHLAGQIFFIQRALAEPIPDVPPIPILEYYRRVSWMNVGHDDAVHVRIRQGSADNAAAGPGALGQRAGEVTQQLRRMLLAEPADRLVRISSWEWSLRLDDFVLTRMMELAVHCDDLAVSAGLEPPAMPDAVNDAVIDLLSRIATRKHGAYAVLRTLTRHERAPATIAAL